MNKLLVFLAVSILLLSACAVPPEKAYHGPEKSAQQLSMIGCGKNISIKAIDDNRGYSGTDFNCDHLVLPGTHTVTFQYYRTANEIGSNYRYNYNEEYTVKFYAHENHKYELMGAYNSRNSNWNFWLLHRDGHDRIIKQGVSHTFIKNKISFGHRTAVSALNF